MATFQQYERLSKAARELIEAAEDMHPDSDKEQIAVVAETAIKFEQHVIPTN